MVNVCIIEEELVVLPLSLGNLLQVGHMAETWKKLPPKTNTYTSYEIAVKNPEVVKVQG